MVLRPPRFTRPDTPFPYTTLLPICFYSRFNLPDLDLYFRDCVIGGPGAFLEVAVDFPDFARAVRRKLILEIAGRTPRDAHRVLPAQAGPDARKIGRAHV